MLHGNHGNLCRLLFIIEMTHETLESGTVHKVCLPFLLPPEIDLHMESPQTVSAFSPPDVYSYASSQELSSAMEKLKILLSS